MSILKTGSTKRTPATPDERRPVSYATNLPVTTCHGTQVVTDLCQQICEMFGQKKNQPRAAEVSRRCPVRPQKSNIATQKYDCREISFNHSGMYFCLNLTFWPSYDNQTIMFVLTARREVSPFLMGKGNKSNITKLWIFLFFHFRTSEFDEPWKI